MGHRLRLESLKCFGSGEDTHPNSKVTFSESQSLVNYDEVLGILAKQC